MANYFTDNPDIVFHFNQLDLREVVEIAEDGYAYMKLHSFIYKKK